MAGHFIHDFASVLLHFDCISPIVFPVSATRDKASCLLVRFYKSFFFFVSPAITADGQGLVILDQRSVFSFLSDFVLSGQAGEMFLSSFFFSFRFSFRFATEACFSSREGASRYEKIGFCTLEGTVQQQGGSFGEGEGHDKGMETLLDTGDATHSGGTCIWGNVPWISSAFF